MNIQPINTYQYNYYGTFCAERSDSDIYKRVKPNYDKAGISMVTKNRVRSLPKLMNMMVSTPIQYMEGNLTTKNFTENYLDMSVPFYKRINLGTSHKLYCTSYRPEIVMIKQITKACDEYQNKDLELEKFNSVIENALEQYKNTPIKRKKFFIA